MQCTVWCILGEQPSLCSSVHHGGVLHLPDEQAVEDSGVNSSHTFVHIGVVYLGNQMFISTLTQPVLDGPDITNVLHVLVLCWIQRHILGTNCKSFHVLALIPNVHHEWNNGRVLLHQTHL